MKKTLQINIAGIVFNIEEDAYEKLKGYLASVQQYFSSYEGSQEIVSDIESRIAEKFISKQKPDSQLLITNEEVNAVIKSMGTVSDFEAIEEEEDLISEKAAIAEKTEVAEETTATASNSTADSSSPKRIYRDMKRKALGGVLAGVAHYFHFDAVWVRIIFLLLFFGVAPIFDNGGFSGFLFIAYFACWVAFPPKDDLEEDPKIKKFFRDPDNKVISGVCGGIGAYFGVDIAIIRLLFVLSVFVFGTGFIAYIILWISSPLANTLTKKMEMKGQPVTLENIETNVKESLNLSPTAPETTAAKVVLFPFRVISAVLTAVGRLLKNLGPVARVFAGIILLIMGGAFTVSVLIATAIFFGFTSSPDWFHVGNPIVNIVAKDIPQMTGIFVFLALFIPAFALATLGLSLISNRQLATRNYWLMGLALWLTGIMGAGIIGTRYSLNYAKKGYVEQTQNFALPANTLILDAKNNDQDDDFSFDVDADIEGYDGTDIKLEQSFSAAGSSREQAEANAKKASYNVKMLDSLLTFDSDMILPDNTPFRNQRLKMNLFIPFNKKFRMTHGFVDHVYEDKWSVTDKYGVDWSDIEKFTFMMKRDSGMVCLDCPKLTDDEREAANQNRWDDNDEDPVINNNDFEESGEFKKTFTVSNFNSIDAGSAFILDIRKGTEFKVEADANRQKDLDDVEIKVSGNVLKIGFEDIFMNNREKVKIRITLPELENLELSGAVQAKVLGFDTKKNMNIGLSGASKAAVAVEANQVKVDISGASRLDLRGSADNVEAEISGASHLDTRQMTINKADIEASGASNARVGKVKDLKLDTSGASSVKRD